MTLYQGIWGRARLDGLEAWPYQPRCLAWETQYRMQDEAAPLNNHLLLKVFAWSAKLTFWNSASEQVSLPTLSWSTTMSLSMQVWIVFRHSPAYKKSPDHTDCRMLQPQSFFITKKPKNGASTQESRVMMPKLMKHYRREPPGFQVSFCRYYTWMSRCQLPCHLISSGAFVPFDFKDMWLCCNITLATQDWRLFGQKL